MFLGVDHGTTAIRFASEKGSIYELSRSSAADLSYEQILSRIEESLGPERVDLVALSYSMGDGLTRIVRLEDALNRGLISQDGWDPGLRGHQGLRLAGHTSARNSSRKQNRSQISGIQPRHEPGEGGPRLWGFPAGQLQLHRMRRQLQYRQLRRAEGRDRGSHRCTYLRMQGPLDVQAIRDVDSGKLTANQAFNWGGILSKMKRMGLDQCSPEERHLAMETLALFAAMEMAALLVLCRDRGLECPQLFLAGSPAREIEPRVSAHLDRRVVPLERSAAAQGCARIAEDVFAGKENILGIAVDERVRAGKEG